MPSHEDVFIAVGHSIQRIFVHWDIYQQLYDSGDANIQLMNSSGSFVFGVLQRLLLDETILALSRLTDPPSTSGRENASIKNLFELARPSLDPQLASEVEASLKRLDAHVCNARTHRNKVIAHSDLQPAVGSAYLPDISYRELDDARQELAYLMQRLGGSTSRRIGGYRSIIKFGTDGHTLLDTLRKSHAE